MILFVNVFITNVRKYPFRYNRYGLPNHDRLNIFKYALASWATMEPLLSKAIFYVLLDRPFKHRQQELDDYIKELFPANKLIYTPYRNWSRKEWLYACDQINTLDDDIIWFTCNDDHVFLDYDLTMVEEAIRLMSESESTFNTCFHSHWPEGIRYTSDCKQTFYGKFANANWNMTDAIQIINKNIFNHWIRDSKYGNMARTDFIKWVHPKRHNVFIPMREMTRHFDGYSHAMHLPDLCPPLTIPDGFFEKDIKILYCSKEKRQGWTTAHPLLPYSTVSKDGVFCRYMLDEIPLFWRNRISEVEKPDNPAINDTILKRARNHEKHELVTCNRLVGGRRFGILPAHWFEHSGCLYKTFRQILQM